MKNALLAEKWIAGIAIFVLISLLTFLVSPIPNSIKMRYGMYWLWLLLGIIVVAFLLFGNKESNKK